jgi:hypothetical protein
VYGNLERRRLGAREPASGAAGIAGEVMAAMLHLRSCPSVVRQPGAVKIVVKGTVALCPLKAARRSSRHG